VRRYEVRTPGIDNLSIGEAPEPAPGPGEALVRVRAVSLNYRDLLVVRGEYGRNVALPIVPLSDCSGDVVQTGAGVARVRPGDRVAAIFMQQWISGALTEAAARSALGGAIPGVFSELAVFKAEGLVHVPAHLSYEEAATLPCAAVTAWHALITTGQITQGETVLVQGSGGVSVYALQFARLAGARVLATTGSAPKMERLRAIGASEVINYNENPDWDKTVRSLTGGGVDHVVEVGGAGTLARSFRATRTNGRISLIGVLSGNQGEVNPVPVLMRNLTVQGIFVGSRDMFEAMNRAVALHELRPVIDRVFAFAEARQALHHMQAQKHFGKIVIRVDA
jgi:NADPH:quinone reductase-like Zn-dependent oxidoreductase